ncbi:unnamed protein product, partial [Cyprideis torosa]
YLGYWYEALRLPNSFTPDYTCVRARYTDVDEDRIVEVYNTGTTEENTVDEEFGIVYQPDLTVPGSLIVEFPGRPAGDYLVLGVDYDKYAAVYACDYFGIVKFELAWILSRDPVIDSESERLARAAFEQFGIDTSSFTTTYHDEACRYEP